MKKIKAFEMVSEIGKAMILENERAYFTVNIEFETLTMHALGEDGLSLIRIANRLNRPVKLDTFNGSLTVRVYFDLSEAEAPEKIEDVKTEFTAITCAHCDPAENNNRHNKYCPNA